VDNCSTDKTLKLLKDLHKKNKMYQYISFSRNFGKDSSMYAGLSKSTGDYVAIMDADLQDPPGLIEEMYKILKEEGYDSVATYRKNRNGEPFLRSILANGFYRIMRKFSKLDIVSGARDYRLMTRDMVNAVLQLEESQRFTKGIFAWVGFNTKWISFDNRERSAGKTKLPTKSAISYAIKGITSFSTIPLLFASITGFIFCFVAVCYAIYTVIKQLIYHEAVPGYPSLMCITLFGFGLVLLVLGIIGNYLSEIYLEIKKRPKYIIKDTSFKEKV
jgi:glycosyltransferase involved in cell wall biosynthesis